MLPGCPSLILLGQLHVGSLALGMSRWEMAMQLHSRSGAGTSSVWATVPASPRRCACGAARPLRACVYLYLHLSVFYLLIKCPSHFKRILFLELFVLSNIKISLQFYKATVYILKIFRFTFTLFVFWDHMVGSCL